ncbi:BREX-2 system adenine-specific DNA-methyltransferase PglX [Actinomadura hibisca]|uniref:BREX-2 system adenine-specific DNA-methyltransferase PglX n=1 Tax=Actinomadura hibisca TaxID=68565 RepID=UPI00083322B4|nr:BREX-2 system adenine-specific DNA-methyltransferase PglX [Actinomadura hibisca]
MIDRKALLKGLRKEVKNLQDDLVQQVKVLPDTDARLRSEYAMARKINRTSASWGSWLSERITQAAVAWVLGTVFVRFTEDNGLISEPYLAAPDPDRQVLARIRYEAYVDEVDDPTYRGWLEQAFAELGAGPAGRLLFDPNHNPLFQIPISHDAAGALITFWQMRDDHGSLVHDFTDPLKENGTEGWDTRFLGDLYQDLSEEARSTFALLQTPIFVEEFILDRAMDPALREFGHEDFKMIDPTCGSGHFVLGAFHRLLRRWQDKPLGRDRPEQVREALNSVHGVDINPFAVAIARFRLLIAAMAAASIRTLSAASAYDWPINLATGDSLISDRQLALTITSDKTDISLAEFIYDVEDVHYFPHILQPGRYHTVVGNPPYIVVKDRSLNKLYRQLYDACTGTYALSVPFAQRFFELAKQGKAERGYGRVGQITANSFMKREFGSKLIENYFGHQVELAEVIDTSGAYIAGHGTPTVILIGTRRSGANRSSTVRTVRSIQGEPAVPEDGDVGFVWSAIVELIDKPGSRSQWVSCEDLDRNRYFAKQPWVLVDGGLEMIEQINIKSREKLKANQKTIGRYTHTGSDPSYFAPIGTWYRFGVNPEHIMQIIEGDRVRDWNISPVTESIFPYSSSLAAELTLDVSKKLWPQRATLRQRREPGGTHEQVGLTWYEWSRWHPERFSSPLGISFAEVATHNHFSLSRNHGVFKQTAPVIKLTGYKNEDYHIALMGILNSSTACLWLKLNCHDKGIRGEGGGFTSTEWERFYQFNSTNIERFPLPTTYPTSIPFLLNHKSQEVSTAALSISDLNTIPTSSKVRESQAKWQSARANMIALQEELDWQVYSLYGLYPEDLRAPEQDVPNLALGERAFEIALARHVANGEASGEWFKRHGSTPITEIPSHWPEPYRQTVQKRIDAIESSRAINMIERPEYKRRWAAEGWDSLQEKALRSWLLDRIEKRELWFDEIDAPALVTLSRLIDMLTRDDDFVSVAKLYRPHEELSKVVIGLMADEHVPFLPSLRYKPSGLKKRASWEHVWDLQRQEDAASDELLKRKIRDSIPAPPKYTSADFLKPSYWRARGKLDVPKERFISYPTALGGQPQLFGWAGWDHQEQALALATYVTNQALSSDEIAPFLAGLLELQPWLNQWHDDFDPLYAVSPAAYFNSYRQQMQGEHGLTDDALRTWRPDPSTRGRGATKK